MKRIFTLCFFVAISLFSLAQSTYMGNNGTGFGGTIGNSSMTITENTNGTITFVLTKGTGGTFNDFFVLYLDVTPNRGETSTTNYTDQSEGIRRAISGKSPGGNALLTFPDNFGADYAIAVAPSPTNASGTVNPAVSGLYALNTSTSGTVDFTQVQAAGIAPTSNNSSVYEFSIQKSNIGFLSSTPATFNFFGTYLNGDDRTFRSNEGYVGMNGAVTSTDGSVTYTGTTNPGYTASKITNFFTFPQRVLPVKLLSFTGSVVDNKGRLNWQVANDDEVSKYEVEKSINGKEFTSIQTIAARRTSAAQAYSTDDANLSGTNYYRLKTTDLQGLVNYSKIVQLSVGVKGQGFTIFPNPVQQTLNIKMAKLEKGRYDVNVYSASGQMVFAKAIQYDGSGNTLQVELPANLQRGNYNCVLSNVTGKFISNFLKQ